MVKLTAPPTLSGMRYASILFILLAAVSLPSISRGDTSWGTLKGSVFDASSLVPVPGASIRTADLEAGTSADSAGQYLINGLPTGVYNIEVSHVGFETMRIDSVEIVSESITDLDFYLVGRPLTLKGITVTPGRFNLMGTEPTSRQTLTRQEFQSIPQLGDDFFRAASRLPGMACNDYSTRFNIRGGDHEEVLVILDGLQIYEPFHLKDVDGGAMSIVDGAVVESLDLMTGGFPAEYGDRMSGVFDIRSRSVNSGQNQASAGISFINARAIAEGGFAGKRGSWMISARRGYIDYVLSLTGPGYDIKPSYWDFFGKVGYQLNEKHLLQGHILYAYDDLYYKDEDIDEGDTLYTEYGNSYAWLTLWSELHPKLSAQTVASIGKVDHDCRGQLANYNSGLPEHSAEEIEGFNFAGCKTDLVFEPSDRVLTKSGGEIKALHADYDYLYQEYAFGSYYSNDTLYWGLFARDTTVARFSRYGTQLSAYATTRYRVASPLVAEFGVRYDYASHTNDRLVSPRFSATLDLSDRTTVRAGWGIYYQIEGIGDISVGDGETDYFPAQKAEHRVIGLEHSLRGGIELRLEAYHKLYSDLRPDLRNFFDPLVPFPEQEWDRAIVKRESGDSRGLEVYVKKDTGGRLSWWLSYACARVEDSVQSIIMPWYDETGYEGAVIPGRYDQRHTVYFDANYRPSPNWQLSTAFQYHTGWPHTGAVMTGGGFFAWQIHPTELWAERHEPFHRLDVRISRHFQFSRGRMTAFVELLNVYNRKNVRAYQYLYGRDYNGDYVLDVDEEYWFGRIPSFGISYMMNF